MFSVRKLVPTSASCFCLATCLSCHVVDGDSAVLVELLQKNKAQSDVFRARTVGAVSCYVQGSGVVAKERYTFKQLSKSKLGHHVV